MHWHRNRSLLLATGALLLGVLACGGSVEPTPTLAPNLPPPPTAAPPTPIPPTAAPPTAIPPSPTSPPPVAFECECDPRATPIDTNTVLAMEMHRATGSYPANCQYWCGCVPPGMTDLDIGITDFNVDLDIYVAWNDYEGVTGAEPIYGESYTWMSNAYGTGDEWVNINNPEAGPYYIEVCSYEGDPSPYNLAVGYR
jgi:hypothetical protein